jgi:hypothetical protein
MWLAWETQGLNTKGCWGNPLKTFDRKNMGRKLDRISSLHQEANRELLSDQDICQYSLWDLSVREVHSQIKGYVKYLSEKHSLKKSTLRPRSTWSFNQRLRVTYNSTLIRRGKLRFILMSECRWSLILRTGMWIFTMRPNVNKSFTRVLLGTSVCEASRTLVEVWKLWNGREGYPIQTCSLWKTDLVGTIYIPCR